MNGRIFILIAATGLFVHVWNANDSARKSNLAAVGVPATSSERSVPVEESGESKSVELSLEIPPSPATDASLHASNEPRIEQWSGFSIDPALPAAAHRQQQISESKSVAVPTAVPMWVEARMMPESLPAGITCGLYQVVDNFGHISLAQISPERLLQSGLHAVAVQRDMYVHQEGNQRWYFIRQGEIEEQRPVPAAANPAASLVSYPTQQNNSEPEVAMNRDAEQDHGSLPLALRPTNLVRRQELAALALAQAGAEQAPVELAMPSWKVAGDQLDRMGQRLQGLAMQALAYWPGAAQWLSDLSTHGDVQVLPQVSLPETEVELPSIPVFRTARPERSSPK